MDIIFDDLDHYGELLADIDEWCEEHGIPTDKPLEEGDIILRDSLQIIFE